MKIKENSWHLRIVRTFKGDEYIPRDLCSYFWKVVGYSLVSLLSYPLLLFGNIIIWLISPLRKIKFPTIRIKFPSMLGKISEWIFKFVIVLFLLSSVAISFYVNWKFSLITFFFTIFIVSLLICISLLLEKLDEKRGLNKWNKKEKQPNLLFSFIKAKKNRICPLIEVME